MRSLFRHLLCAAALAALPALACAQVPPAAEGTPNAALLAPRHGSEPQVLFWMSNGLSSVTSFLAHKDKIGILSPTWYSIEEAGLVAGEPQPVVLRTAQAAHITLLPLFAMFDPERAHRLALDLHAQDEMNAGFIRECRDHGYQGINVDIENVRWTDRDAFSAMIRRTSEALHRAGLLVSIDVVPGAPGHPGASEFDRWIFEDWRGAYDIKALGEAVDLLCLMTYDQSTHWTTPGPVGGWMWTNENLTYALQSVPPGKLSLGIAAYGYRWYTGDPGLNKPTKAANVTSDYISAATAFALRDTYGAQEQWDQADHTPWFYFYRDNLREWVFFTDRRAFMDRYGLAEQHHLEGVCSWVLGEEDPAIWTALPDAR